MTAHKTTPEHERAVAIMKSIVRKMREEGSLLGKREAMEETNGLPEFKNKVVVLGNDGSSTHEQPQESAKSSQAKLRPTNRFEYRILDKIVPETEAKEMVEEVATKQMEIEFDAEEEVGPTEGYKRIIDDTDKLKYDKKRAALQLKLESLRKSVRK